MSGIGQKLIDFSGEGGNSQEVDLLDYEVRSFDRLGREAYIGSSYVGLLILQGIGGQEWLWVEKEGRGWNVKGFQRSQIGGREII